MKQTQGSQALPQARLAQEAELNILKRYAASLQLLREQARGMFSSYIAAQRIALKIGFESDIEGVTPDLESLAHYIKADAAPDAAQAPDGAEEDSSETEESADENADSTTSFSPFLDCSALEAVHITVAALKTSPLEWDFNLLRLVQLLITELKRLRKLPVIEPEHPHQPPAISDAIVDDALTRATEPRAAQAAGPQGKSFTAQFVRDSFPKPFIQQLERLYELAYDNFIHADNLEDRESAKPLPMANFPHSINATQWPLPCNLDGYQYDEAKEIRDAQRLRLHVLALKQLVTDAQQAAASFTGRDGKGEVDDVDDAAETESANETQAPLIDIAGALDALWEQQSLTPNDLQQAVKAAVRSCVDADADADAIEKARAEAENAFWQNRASALRDAASHAPKFDSYVLEDDSEDDSEETSSEFDPYVLEDELEEALDASQPTPLQQAWDAISTTESELTPKARYQALIHYAELRGEVADSELQQAIKADLSAEVTAYPGEALFAALEQLAKTNHTAAQRLAVEATPLIKVSMPSDTNIQKGLKGEALLICALVAQDNSTLNIALMLLNHQQINVGNIAMPKQLNRVAFQSLRRVLNSNLMFNFLHGPVLRQRILAQYALRKPEYTEGSSGTSGKSEASEQDVQVNAADVHFTLINRVLDKDDIIAGLRCLNQYCKQAGNDIKTTALLVQAQTMLAEHQTPKGLYQDNPFVHIKALEDFFFSVIAKMKGLDVLDSNGLNAHFIRAVEGRNIFEIMLTLRAGADVNAIKEGGQTMLRWCAQHGHLEIARMLLQHDKIQVDAADRRGQTALLVAAEFGHTEVVKLLLQNDRVAVNLANKFGYTALMMATQHHHSEIVQLLCQNNSIEINAKDKNGHTALMMAAQQGRVESVTLLLLNPRINVNAQNNLGDTALHLATQYNHAKIVHRLTRHPDIDYYVENKRDYTPLISAIKHNATAGARALCTAPAFDVNARFKYNRTELMRAANSDNGKVGLALLELPGIDVNAIDESGQTALMYTLRGNFLTLEKTNIDLLKALLSYENININAQNSGGYNVLMLAVYWGKINAVRAICQAKNLAINATNDKGDTALHIALRKNVSKIYFFLLDLPGINPYIHNNHGQTTLHIAKQNGLIKVTALLLEKKVPSYDTLHMLNADDSILPRSIQTLLQLLYKLQHTVIHTISEYRTDTPNAGIFRRHGNEGKQRASALLNELLQIKLPVFYNKSVMYNSVIQYLQQIITLINGCVRHKGMLGHKPGLSNSSLNTRLMRALNQEFKLGVVLKLGRGKRLPKNAGRQIMTALLAHVNEMLRHCMPGRHDDTIRITLRGRHDDTIRITLPGIQPSSPDGPQPGVSFGSPGTRG